MSIQLDHTSILDSITTHSGLLKLILPDPLTLQSLTLKAEATLDLFPSNGITSRNQTKVIRYGDIIVTRLTMAKSALQQVMQQDGNWYLMT